uniref:Zinc finger GRF-type domain-containing protein n=1 Tax=Aegilops tauschii subsp. strangulata TaxID=200361 RepID=A0A453SAA8_AEGTS
MPSWPNSNETSDADDYEYMDEYSSMQMEYFQTPNTVIDPSFSGLVVESDRKCILHRQRPGRFVAFEGTDTGRRFIGCATTWVDAPWPVILQRCLTKLWDMYHEENLGRVQEKEAHEIEVGKLKKELDSLANQYSQLVDDVSKLFDYQDGKKSHDMDYTSQAINELKEKKHQLVEQAKIEVQMEKLKLKKEQRCILQSQADIIQNTWKAMKEIQVERYLLKEEKKKLEHVISELLKVGHGCKEKLDKIKQVVMEE